MSRLVADKLGTASVCTFVSCPSLEGRRTYEGTSTAVSKVPDPTRSPPLHTSRRRKTPLCALQATTLSTQCPKQRSTGLSKRDQGSKDILHPTIIHEPPRRLTKKPSTTFFMLGPHLEQPPPLATRRWSLFRVYPVESPRVVPV